MVSLPFDCDGGTTAAAQTSDELKARVAALEKANEKLHEALASRRAASGPRKTEARDSQSLATTTMPAAAYAKAPLPPLLADSWTGFYVGGNAGLSVAKNATRFDRSAQLRRLRLDTAP